MGLTKLICLGGILNIPPKISIHKAGKHNWVIYDLFKPLERLTEDIIQSCQSNWLFTWKRSTTQPMREPADLRTMPSRGLSLKWPLQDCHLCRYCVKIKPAERETESEPQVNLASASRQWHGFSRTPPRPSGLRSLPVADLDVEVGSLIAHLGHIFT